MILREDSILPTKWPLGRVIEVYPGKDELVRVATVKTHAGVRTRPVTNCYLLINKTKLNFYLCEDHSVLAGGVCWTHCLLVVCMLD